MMDKLWPRYGLQRNAVHKLAGKVPLEHCWARHHSLHDIHSAPSSLSSSDSIRNNGAGATQLDDPKQVFQHYIVCKHFHVTETLS